PPIQGQMPYGGASVSRLSPPGSGPSHGLSSSARTQNRAGPSPPRPPQPNWSSLALARPIFHPRVYRDPVYFPSFAPVIRERLFKSARIEGNVRDNESNKDGSTIEHFLVVKLTTPIFEAANCGLTQSTALAIGEIKTPLVGLGIV